ncbi:GTPase IMAP family member 8-like [Neolamprologus brichardi]|uniref:GTPase IMAP family member 8-like n=1 Tax=Neolamprologus brichardi TaxID=32507 RepID=UPI001643B1C4|nr:GTPase IMAP family member 8-like [Neolamprologus brichardi]
MLINLSEPLRIVLLGKSGSGKSSLANTIFGETVFEIDHTATSGTSQCTKATKVVNRTSVTIIDTPGFFDNRRSKEELKNEITRCVVECSPGPHAFLILLKKDKYTDQEIEVITNIIESFSEEAFRFAVLVFTRGDDLPEGTQIEEFCRGNNGLRELLERCGGRCHVFDNKHWNNNPQDEYRNNQLQREKLLNTITEMVRNNGGGCYTNEMLQEEPLRIVLLGKSGSGKSSLANTIFGETVFEIDHTATSGTSQCTKATKVVNRTSVTIIDTPGFFDNRRSKEELKNEITRCVVECSPGPHAFLILLKKDKYTDQEIEVITNIIESFSEEAFRFAVLVFTRGDDLPEGTQIEEFCRGNNGLRELLERCGGRCHVFDNKHWNNNPQDEYRNNQLQREKLLNTITEMVRNNGGGCYTNEMLQEVEKAIQQQQERIRSSSSGDMPWEEIREEAKKRVYNALKMASGVTTGMLLGALLGVPMMIAAVITLLKTALSPVVAGVVQAKLVTGVGLGVVAGLAATAGAIGGGYVGYHNADKADSIMEAVMDTAEALGELAVKAGRRLINPETEQSTHLIKRD